MTRLSVTALGGPVGFVFVPIFWSSLCLSTSALSSSEPSNTPNYPHLLNGEQVGLAQYTLRQYDAAEASFEAVRHRDPYRLACMDTYSNILYVKVRIYVCMCACAL